MKKRRYSLLMTDEFAVIVERIAKEQQCTRSEVIRRAVGITATLLDRAKRGKTTVIYPDSSLSFMDPDYFCD